MPKLWEDTIESHRGAVREAALDAAMALVAEHGLPSVTMSAIAERSGIGRATLYKYFPDIHAILQAWHERQIAEHLDRLTRIHDQYRDPAQRLRAVVEAYALSRYGSRGHDEKLAGVLHGDRHVESAEAHLHDLLTRVIGEAVKVGAARDDVTADELASYVLSAMAAAARLRSKAAVERLVAVTLDGLKPS